MASTVIQCQQMFHTVCQTLCGLLETRQSAVWHKQEAMTHFLGRVVVVPLVVPLVALLVAAAPLVWEVVPAPPLGLVWEEVVAVEPLWLWSEVEAVLPQSQAVNLSERSGREGKSDDGT